MTVLHTLAITLGILAVVKSLTGMLWPKGYRDFAKKMLESDVIIRVSAVVAILIGGIIVVAVLKGSSWLEIVLLVLAFLYLPLGVIILWNPEPYRRLANKMLYSGDLAFRLWCGLGVLIGFLLCFLGFFG
jgi:uncharacterized protein YjeT (DUF2065 family)